MEERVEQIRIAREDCGVMAVRVNPDLISSFSPSPFPRIRLSDRQVYTVRVSVIAALSPARKRFLYEHNSAELVSLRKLPV